MISFPANLPIAGVGDNDDERLRLLYVAITRARRELIITTHERDARGKEAFLAHHLTVDSLSATSPTITELDRTLIASAETTWHERLIRLPHGDMRSLLQPVLENYKLSATHLNNFLDVSSGGPQTFLLQNILRFPQAIVGPAQFGSAIHAVLQRAHAHLNATGKRRPTEDILHDYERELQRSRLNHQEVEKLLAKGSTVLSTFLNQRYDSFHEGQLPEKSFANQGVVVDGVRLNGVIDLLEIHPTAHEITVTDYKTGRSTRTWKGSTDYEKIKLHKYRQQLMFYKLLVEHSRDYGGRYGVEHAIIEFVEPDDGGQIQRLEMLFDAEEMQRFRCLLMAVWHKITTLDLPDISDYEPNYRGIMRFEDDLLAGAG